MRLACTALGRQISCSLAVCTTLVMQKQTQTCNETTQTCNATTQTYNETTQTSNETTQTCNETTQTCHETTLLHICVISAAQRARLQCHFAAKLNVVSCKVAILQITTQKGMQKVTPLVNLGGKPGTCPEGVSSTRAPSFTLMRKPIIRGFSTCRQKVRLTWVLEELLKLRTRHKRKVSTVLLLQGYLICVASHIANHQICWPSAGW